MFGSEARKILCNFLIATIGAGILNTATPTTAFAQPDTSGTSVSQQQSPSVEQVYEDYKNIAAENGVRPSLLNLQAEVLQKLFPDKLLQELVDSMSVHVSKHIGFENTDETITFKMVSDIGISDLVSDLKSLPKGYELPDEMRVRDGVTFGVKLTSEAFKKLVDGMKYNIKDIASKVETRMENVGKERGVKVEPTGYDKKCIVATVIPDMLSPQQEKDFSNTGMDRITAEGVSFEEERVDNSAEKHKVITVNLCDAQNTEQFEAFLDDMGHHLEKNQGASFGR